MITVKPKAKWQQFRHPMGGQWYRWGDCSAHVALEIGLWHLSISHPRRYPSWDEIYQAWYDLIPEAQNRTGAIILPKKVEYVNIHPNCFHVHELSDGEESDARIIRP